MKNTKLIIIAAVSIDGVIGIDNDIPWKVPEDFKHFRNTTIGNALIVGQNTFKTLPPKAFENRQYFVINNEMLSKQSFSNKIYRFNDINTALHVIFDEHFDKDKVYVAGGAMVYNTLIDYCDEAIITWINNEYPEGNKKFPIINLFTNFEIILNDQEWQMSKSGIEYRIVHYKRTGQKKQI